MTIPARTLFKQDKADQVFPTLSIALRKVGMQAGPGIQSVLTQPNQPTFAQLAVVEIAPMTWGFAMKTRPSR